MAVVGSAEVLIRPNASTFAAETGDQVKSGLSKVSALLGLGLALGVADALKNSLESADAFEKSEARLKTSIADTGGQFDKYKSQIAAADSQGQKFGHSNAEIDDALAQLTLRTGNVNTAIKDLNTVENVSAGLHVDMSSAITLISKAEAGSSTALKRLGINFQSTGDKAADAAAIIKLLGERFAGQAQSQAETFAGKMAALRAEMTNVEQKIGLAVIPIIEDLGTGLAATAGFVERNKTAFEALGVVVGAVLVPAMTSYVIKQAEAFGTAVYEGIIKLAASWGLVTTSVEAATVAVTEEGAATDAAAAGGLAKGSLALTGLGSAAAGAAAPIAAVGVAFVGAALLSKHFTDQDNANRAQFVANATKRGDLSKEVNSRILADEKIVADFKKAAGTEDADRYNTAQEDIIKLTKVRDQAHAAELKQHTESQAAAAATGVAYDATSNSVVIFGQRLKDNSTEYKNALKEVDAFNKGLASSFASGEDAFTKFFKDSSGGLKGLTTDMQANLKQEQGFATDLQTLITAHVSPTIIDALIKAGPAAKEQADLLIKGIGTGQTAAISAIADNEQRVLAATQAILDTEAQGSGKSVGTHFSEGIALGITDPVALAAFDAAASAAIGHVENKFYGHARIQSPSRRFAENIGRPLALGIASGLEQALGQYAPDAGFSKFTATVKRALAPSALVPGGIGGLAGAGSGVHFHPGSIVVNVPPGTPVATAAKQFESAMARVIVRTKMGTGATG